MKKFYKISLLFLSLIFLTTFNPIEFNNFKKKNNYFFKVKYLEVTGNQITNQKDIINKLSQIIDQNIFFVEKKDIEVALKEIDFVGNIDVKKKYPNTIIIRVNETKPIAIFFKNNNKYLLDNLSNLISYRKISNDFYPTIFGKGAEDNFANFFKKLKANKFPQEIVKNYYYYQIGRWDLQLLNGKTIKLPANGLEEAFKLAIDLLGHKNFKNYNTIDLRIDDKIVVE